MTNQTSNQPVLMMADMSKPWVDEEVEQADVPDNPRRGQYGGRYGANAARRVRARIARTSDQLDPRTRTPFVELEVDNSENFLVPGSFKAM